MSYRTCYGRISIGLRGSETFLTQNFTKGNTKLFEDLKPGKVYNISLIAISVVEPNSTKYTNTFKVPSRIVATSKTFIKC